MKMKEGKDENSGSSSVVVEYESEVQQLLTLAVEGYTDRQ